MLVLTQKSFDTKIDSKIFCRKKLTEPFFIGAWRVGANKKLALNFAVKRRVGAWRKGVRKRAHCR